MDSEVDATSRRLLAAEDRRGDVRIDSSDIPEQRSLTPVSAAISRSTSHATATDPRIVSPVSTPGNEHHQPFVAPPPSNFTGQSGLAANEGAADVATPFINRNTQTAERPHQRSHHGIDEYEMETPEGRKPGAMTLVDSVDETVDENDREHEKSSMSYPRWKPFWLGQLPIAIFVAVFASIAVALTGMLAASEKNDGIAEASEGLVYLWRFGPTAVFTLITVFWSRVELQTLRYMPWMVTQGRPSRESDVYNLDYTSMLLPTALYQSIKRRHFLVSFAILVTLLLRVQIVLSPSLFGTLLVKQDSTVELEVLSAFNRGELSDDSLAGNVTSFPYYSARAVQQFDMQLPFGLAQDLAYQTFSSDQGSRATAENPLRAVVDGMFMEMQCREMETYNATLVEEDGPFIFNIEFQFEDCEETVTVEEWPVSLRPPTSRSNEGGSTHWDLWTDLPDKRPCSSLPQETDQFIYWSAYFSPNDDDEPEVDSIAAIICSSSSYISKVEVVDNGRMPNVTLQDGKRETIETDLWGLLVESLENSGAWAGSSSRLQYSPLGPLFADMTMRGLDSDADDKSLYKSEVLHESIMNLVSNMGPMIGHALLREEKSSRLEGTSLKMVDRLTISLGVGVTMICLSFLCACFALLVLFKSRSLSHGWHRDPATILGSMTVFRDQSSSESTEADKAKWRSNSFTPLPLQPWVRCLGIVFGIGLIVGLLVALDASRRSDGLATIHQDQETSDSLLWKSIPALAMVCVALYTSSSDTVLRSLATHTKLKNGHCDAQTLDRSLLDMLGLRALYFSFRLGLPAVSVLQILAILCSFLTILSSALFTTQTVPDSTDISIETQSWFASRPNLDFDETVRYRDTLGSLLLMRNTANISHPRNTYGDLVFPTIDVTSNSIEDAGVAMDDTIVVDMILPAARLKSSCKKGTYDKIEFEDDLMGARTATIFTSFKCSNGSVLEKETTMGTLAQDGNEEYLMAETGGGFLDESGNCSFGMGKVPWRTWQMREYSWGRVSNNASEFDFFSTWQCNVTWEEVPTEVRLVPGTDEGEFIIDGDRRPSPKSDDAKPWDPPFSIPDFDGEFLSGAGQKVPIWPRADNNPAGVDPQFASLLKPFGPFSIEDVVSPEQESDVLEALNGELAFAAAQLANTEHRLSLDETIEGEPNPRESVSPIRASVVDTSRRRLMQNAAITYVLVGIISFAVLINIWALVSTHLLRYEVSRGKRPSWLHDFELRGLAPDGFSSMAMTEALLHGSNAASHLPQGAHAMRPVDLFHHLSGQLFRLGWFFNGRASERVFTVGLLDDDNFDSS